MPRSIITLTTDFGLSDHFVGAMKGVILSIAPNARLVDITHEITPYDIAQGGYTVSQFYSFFPKKTVHVVVVDPGVGTSRRPILVEAGGQYFIAPDNGVMSMVYSREKHRVREITAERYFRRPVSDTFHGRDIFAPCAAHLTAGVSPTRFGKPIRDYLRSGYENPVQTGKRFWTGAVLKVDRFGNLITNLKGSEFPNVGKRPFEFAIGAERLDRFVHNFAECPIGELAVLVGSAGYFEIVSNQASAAKMLGCGAGAPVELIQY